MKSLCDLIGAGNAFWVGTVLMLKECAADLLQGWRIRGIHYMDQAYLDPIRVRSAMQVKMIDDPGATNIALAASAGQFRAYRLTACTLVDLATFSQTEHYDIYYTRPGVVDRL